MVTVITRAENGIPLTHDQVDNNFTDLADAINNIGDDILAPAIAAKDEAVSAANSANLSAQSSANSANAASISRGNAATSAEQAAASAIESAAYINALTAPDGASKVGYLQAGVDAVSQTVEDALRTTVTPENFGAMANGVSSDSGAVNKAILFLVKSAAVGGVVKFASGKRYYLPDPILVPSHINIDFTGAILVGAGATVGTMFRTAYFDGTILVSNVGTLVETKTVVKSSVYGGEVENCGQVFDFYDFIDGCSVHHIAALNCRQFGLFDRCFYAKFDRLTCRGGSDASIPTYHFKGANNAIVLTSVACVTAFGFRFDDCAALTMISCSSEGGVKGIKFVGDCLAFNQIGNYYEGIQGTVYDFTEAGTVATSFTGNYINLVDVVFDDGGNPAGGPTLFGTFDESNFLANVGTVDAGYTYRGLMRISAPGNLIRYRYRGDNQGVQTVPSNWILGKNSDFTTVSSANATGINDFRQKALYSGIGIIPVRRGGDTGPVYPGSIFFCTYSSVSGTVNIDTQITWQPNSLFAKFCFTVQDGNGIAQVFGDIYGADASKRHSGPITVTAINNGGYVRLILGITGDLVTITGSVQIVG